MAIDFDLSPEQAALQKAAQTFADNRLALVEGVIAPFPTPEERFAAIKPFYQEMVDAGFLKALLPVEYGGTAMSSLDFAIAAEELTRADINVPTALLGTGLGLQPIIHFGTAEQKAKFLPAFAGDQPLLAAWAFTETAGGANFDTSDTSGGVQTFARLDGDEWVINGDKHFTTNASGWDGTGSELISVLCRTDPALPPAESLAVIVVPGNTAGIKVESYIDTMGHRATISPRITFTDVRVPAGNLIGQPGDGREIARKTFNWTSSIIGAACVGRMRAAFDYAFAFAKTDRRSGPVPIIDYPTVGYMLVDIKTRIEAARYLTWKACDLYDKTGGADEELGHMAKIYASELSVQTVYDTMRVVGVNSYGDQTPIAGIMEDVLCFPLYDGGNMGVRRRQLHALLQRADYDPMQSAAGIVTT
ncbi:MULTISPECIES: acyl-CoA dehydrogenase family protein [unclassified Rhodococcus (in: high G+C Gram-positive bacteria)]|uniref:acyl-CoA dehydrogenase family protein n=1 Tax=unclassified Rhodococcus (in: high G+C Gram-positive bacteria) TaxID=192944 RepID=UPI00163B3864|nr:MULTISPECIES: acyl-CoA dehydrogenase family protein [unclassified Rhodococcus (in: high G+C Gram-positive bacteria)]MBC2644312.1 acyl-CoA/acyl-ACP dehydrogenase [Rhodococcus sp. 3A]MBC2897995.1 acyl-CoA/acyl-ACP dehydrogenase [Rhodococcus sp. 4CII]